MLNIFFWVVFGVLSGWTIALIAQPEAAFRQIAGSDIVGALGGVLGGVLARLLTHQPVIDGFDGPSILIAVLIAVAVACVFNFIFNGHIKT